MALPKPKTIILTIFFCLFFTMPVFAQLDDDLIVIFNPDPLFNQASFLPGQSATAWIEVKNKSGEEKPIAVHAINVDDQENFGDVLNLKISQANEIYFDNTLTKFLNFGEMFLSNLADEASTTYEFVISFNPDAGNGYQGKILNNFDIVIGFQGEESIGKQVSNRNNGSVGGGYYYDDLIIFDENITEVGESYAIIAWITNKPATSRIIYDTFSHPDISKESSPNYGYMFSNDENSSLATGHSMLIDNLMAETTYYFRPVSHASPEKTGAELSFTTLSKNSGQKEFFKSREQSKKENKIKMRQEKKESGAGPGKRGVEEISDISSKVEDRNNKQLEKIIKKDQKKGLNKAMEKMIAGATTKDFCKQYPWWVFILILLCYLFTLNLYYKYWKEKHFKNWIYFPVIFSGVVIFLLVIWLVNCWP